jgi:osmotically-inducible protein OsmY
MALPDATIRTKILDGLKKQSWAHTHTLNVTVTNGIVDLWGYAESGDQRKAIRVLAEAIPGVTSSMITSRTAQTSSIDRS